MTRTISDQTSIVASLYEAFGRGDVPTILDLLADDVAWDGDWVDNFAQRDLLVPHLRPRRGHAQVADFFAVLATYTVHEFQVLRLLAGPDAVVAQVILDVSMPGAARVRDEELHLWTFGPEGKITALRHYVDTAKHLAAARSENTASGNAISIGSSTLHS